MDHIKKLLENKHIRQLVSDVFELKKANKECKEKETHLKEMLDIEGAVLELSDRSIDCTYYEDVKGYFVVMGAMKDHYKYYITFFTYNVGESWVRSKCEINRRN